MCSVADQGYKVALPYWEKAVIVEEIDDSSGTVAAEVPSGGLQHFLQSLPGPALRLPASSVLTALSGPSKPQAIRTLTVLPVGIKTVYIPSLSGRGCNWSRRGTGHAWSECQEFAGGAEEKRRTSRRSGAGEDGPRDRRKSHPRCSESGTNPESAKILDQALQDALSSKTVRHVAKNAVIRGAKPNRCQRCDRR